MDEVPEEWISTQDFMARRKCCKNTASKALKAALVAGMVEMRKFRVMRNNTVVIVKFYRLKG